MEDETNSIPLEQAEQAYNDDRQDYGDFVNESQEEAQFGSAIEPTQKENLLTLFWKILGLKHSWKVANLDKPELGRSELSVRSHENLALLGNLLHNKAFEDWFQAKAEITLATSMSKRGWFPELIVSQKKFSQRAVSPIVPSQQQKKPFLGLGGNKQQPQQQ